METDRSLLSETEKKENNNKLFIKSETQRERDKRDGGTEAKNFEWHKKREETNGFIVSNNYCGSRSTEETNKFRTFFIGKISPKSESEYQKIRKWSGFVGFSRHKWEEKR